MNDVIELRDLRCEVIVGVLDAERVTPQSISIDLDLHRDIDDAARDDDLHATTNYADVLALAVRVASDGQFLLLETLADRVARAVLDLEPAVSAVTIVVRKLVPPVPERVATVGVRRTLERDR